MSMYNTVSRALWAWVWLTSGVVDIVTTWTAWRIDPAGFNAIEANPIGHFVLGQTIVPPLVLLLASKILLLTTVYLIWEYYPMETRTDAIVRIGIVGVHAVMGLLVTLNNVPVVISMLS